MSDELAAIVRSFADRVWNAGDFTGGEELFAPGFRHHDLVTHRETDLTGYFDSIRHQRWLFPGIRFEITDAVANHERVASRWMVVGVHAASRRRVTIHGMSIDRISAGRIDENWTVWDRHGLREQLAGEAGSEQ